MNTVDKVEEERKEQHLKVEEDEAFELLKGALCEYVEKTSVERDSEMHIPVLNLLMEAFCMESFLTRSRLYALLTRWKESWRERGKPGTLSFYIQTRLDKFLEDPSRVQDTFHLDAELRCNGETGFGSGGAGSGGLCVSSGGHAFARHSGRGPGCKSGVAYSSDRLGGKPAAVILKGLQGEEEVSSEVLDPDVLSPFTDWLDRANKAGSTVSTVAQRQRYVLKRDGDLPGVYYLPVQHFHRWDRRPKGLLLQGYKGTLRMKRIFLDVEKVCSQKWRLVKEAIHE